MRNWDNWDSYLDNDGNPLHGKIRFCKKGTTENVIIYNSDEIAIRNPSFTDMLGRTEYQVFLDSEADVTAYFYKYIGSGEMMREPAEDYDPARWALQYTSDNMDPTSKISITSDTAIGVNDMTGLRALDPDRVPEVGGMKLVWLYGYYENGDCAPVLYMWDSASLESDDGGAVIMANSIPGRGRWLLVSRELHFDVRHFGVFPTDDIYSTDTSYTSQIANCATYIDSVGCDAWFPALKDEASYYLFDGANTFSIKGDIYVSDAVRFQCKNGTSGTRIQCHELHKRTPGLFVSTVNTGTGTLVADWVNISWVGGMVTGDARVGWVIDSSEYPRQISGKEVKFLTNGHPSLILDNCLITSNKKITGRITIQNSVLKTDFFSDRYTWGDLTSIGNTILLENCKNANTYILLKNKQYDPMYGDLGEQTVSSSTLLAGAVAENAMFNGVNIKGACELHNVSGTVNIVGSGLHLNAIDCWLTVSSGTVAEALAMRRGSLTGSGLQVLDDVYLEGVIINIPLTTLGADTLIKNCDINYKITATDIRLLNNQIYAEVDQRDNSYGTLTVKCSGNMFHDGAQHYVHSTTPNTKVVGSWIGNGSTYDNKHWIRLDRTNLKTQDNDHQYTYANNSEPYLMKYSGRNHPMHFPIYRGDRFEGRGIFETTNIPFVFLNSRTYECFCVPRSVSWKCFSVGRGFLARSGTLRATWDYGIFEDSYNDHTNGYITIIMNWGAQSTSNSAIMGGSAFGYSNMVSRDGAGIANYDVSFESADADHNPSTAPGGVFSNGVMIGVLNRSPYDGWDHFAKYPATPMQSINLFVHMDPDFQAGSTTPANF